MRLGLMRNGILLVQDSPQEVLRKSGQSNMEEAFLFYASHQEVQK